ncbi:hypothetical protein TNCV_5110591 [Trichonephila clavipes]|nr:hypothetical protein TNCV_5110591 [Trichonephila clavipes]
MQKRGQRLDPNGCIGYYCKQQIGSSSYFASNYPIQRGCGLFSNLRRYAMPIIWKPNFGGRTGKILRPSSVALKSKNQEINRLQLAVKLPWTIFFESVDNLS